MRTNDFFQAHEGCILWQWTPDEAYIAKMKEKYPYADLAECYVVVGDEDADLGLIVYARYRNVWDANPWSTRAIIGKMLEDLKGTNNA